MADSEIEVMRAWRKRGVVMAMHYSVGYGPLCEKKLPVDMTAEPVAVTCRACMDLITAHVGRSVTLLPCLQEENAAFRTALNEIASWGEGSEVKPSFDSPVEAKKARDVLAKYPKK